MTASPFYVAVTGNALANNSVINSSPVLSTPKRIPAVLYNNNNNNSNNQQGHEAQHHVRELSQLKPSTDRHLEQAICELEQIYRSLKLDGDEDLLDRAERRDLPTAHQQLSHQHQQLAQQHHPVYPFSGCSGSESGGDPLGGHGITSDLDTMMNWSISGSFENLAANPDRPRVRTPSSRRSAVPDKVADDMAVRRLAAAGRKSQVNDPQMIAAQSGSYLLLSPSVTAAEDHQPNDGSSRSGSSPDEPDIVYDDVAYRHIRQVNQSLRVAEPQPFGIPLGPVTPASPSDYLHTCVTPEKMELRPLLHPTKYPDLIRDDLAFRNLRKDAGQVQLPLGPVNTDKLDDLLQETGFSSKTMKKKRAVRSLSANIAQLIRKDAARPSGGGGVVDFNRVDDEEEDERYISLNPFDSRAQSLSDLLDESASSVYNNNNNNVYVAKLTAKTPRAVKQRSGLKRNVKASETDETDALIVQRQVRPTASWVERAHLSDAPATVTANSNSEAICISAERVPALAKLFPTSALLPAKKFDQIGASDRGSKEDLEMDHLIAELSVAGESSGVGLESSALKPPTGICATGEVETSSPAGHYWEESPLFQSQPQFTFASAATRRSVSPANSSDSGQVSCCAREVRQILHHQIRQEEIERERLASSGEVVVVVAGHEPADDQPIRSLHAACTTPARTVEDDVNWNVMHDTLPLPPSPPPPPPPICTDQQTPMSPSPILVGPETDWNGPGSDDGIDSLPARSSSDGGSSSLRSSPDEEWSNSSRRLSSSSSSEHDDDEHETNPTLSPVPTPPPPAPQLQLQPAIKPCTMYQTATARWLSPPRVVKEVDATAAASSSAAGSARLWLDRHFVHRVVCAGCVLTSLLTLCGLDLATCAHLLLALLALAAVFCDMH